MTNIIFSKEELSKIFLQNISQNISDICINSKETKKEDLFIALKGERVDGHDFIEDAIAKGASLAISEKNIKSIPEKKIIRVQSSYEALLKLANYNISKANKTKYLAITGSVGKTTTKNMIYHIIKEAADLNDDDNNIYVTKKNYNSQIGLPICAATMPRNTKIAIFEMGMSNFGDIRKLTQIVKPNVAVITSIGENHLEFFDSQLEIARAKAEIFEQSTETAIIPNDSPYADFLKDKAIACGAKNIIFFGEGTKSNARCISRKLIDNNNIEVNANIFGINVKYKIPCTNLAFAVNSVAAIAAANAISEIKIPKLAEAFSSFHVSTKRNEMIHVNVNTENHNMHFTIIDDSYNAAPASMKAALHSLGALQVSSFNKETANTNNNSGRKIAVIGDMLELGANAAFYHENLAATIGKDNINLVFACGNLCKRLFDNLPESRRGCWKENSHELSESVLKEVKDGDCILIKGSHSMNMDYIVEKLKSLN